MTVTDEVKFKVLKYPNEKSKGTTIENDYTWEEIVKMYETPEVNTPKDDTDAEINKAKFKSGLYMFGKFDEADGIRNRRLKKHMLYRSAICLDYDDIDQSFDEVIGELTRQLDLFTINSKYIIHTTFKHTKDKPRFRVIIPLTEPVSPSDYSMVVKELSKRIKFKLDDSSDQAERVMCAPNKKTEESHYHSEARGKLIMDPLKTLSVLGGKISEQDQVDSKPSGNSTKSNDKGPTNDWELITKGTTEGGRNNALTQLVGKCVNAGFDDEYTLACAMTFGKEKCNPPLDEKEIMQVFNSITKTDSRNWQENLQVSERGNVKDTYINAEIILKNDETVHDILAYDMFSHAIKFKKRPYWKHRHDNNLDLSDFDIIAIKRHFENNYNIRLSTDRALEFAEIDAKESSYHPIKSKIEEYQWDGVERAESLFIDFLGVEDTEYHREITRVSLTGAVARIYKPGVEFHTALIMLGKQGDGKSMILQKLGMGYTVDSLNSLQTKDDMQLLHGSWLIELAELAPIKKTGIEESKRFISAREDKIRLPYGRMTGVFKRQCAFFGTTNNHDFLKDQTGNRRFLPMNTRTGDYATKSVSSDLTDKYVQQVWAEVLTWWQDEKIEEKEKLVLSDEMKLEAEKHQLEHTEENGYQTIVDSYLEQPIPSNFYGLSLARKKVRVQDRIDLRDISTFDNGSIIQLKNHKPGEYEWRTKVCAQEIWYLALGNSDAPTPAKLRKIKEAIASSKYYVKTLKNPVQFGDGIGKIRGFEINLEGFYTELDEIPIAN